MADTPRSTNGHHPTAGLPLRTLSALGTRAALAARLGWAFSGDRKIHEILGYKTSLVYRDFKAKYSRQDLCNRIVKAYPEATWAQPPQVKEDDNDAAQTAFEAAWESLTQRLAVFERLRRADILANLGQYAVLVIGLRGQADLHNPARPVRSPEEILYLTPYSEEWATIERFEGNPASPTFGQPLLYRINFGRSSDRGRAVLPVGPGLVHASRVIHIAEDLLDDDVYGIPRLEPIYDRLDDVLKVVGGAGEGFWQDAKRRLVFALREGYQLKADDEAAFADEIEEFIHELRNFVRVEGVDVTPIQGQVASPEHHFTILLDVIAGATGIPKRILIGSERGELASSQDTETWLGRVTQRQQQFAEPRILRPLIDRLILFSALPQPAQPYTVVWENLFGLSEDQQATIAEKVASATQKFAQAEATGFNPLKREVFITEYLGLPEDALADLLDLESDEEQPVSDDATDTEAPAEEVHETDDDEEEG